MRQVPKIDFNPFVGFFLDLDGVFADFDGMLFKLTGKYPRDLAKKEMWKTVNSRHDFWSALELMQDAHHLWEYTRQFDPVFLTGLPSKQGGKEQKEGWVRDKLGSQWTTHVVPKRDKQLHSGPNKVLIDDNQGNIDQWTEKGGHGVFHTGDVWETIDKVEALRKGYRP